MRHCFRIYRIENMIWRVENCMSQLMIRRNRLRADLLQLLEEDSMVLEGTPLPDTALQALHYADA